MKVIHLIGGGEVVQHVLNIKELESILKLLW